MKKSKNGRPSIVIIVAVLTSILLSGCSHAVKYSVDDIMRVHTPRTVAVLPIVWSENVDKQDSVVASIFRSMTNKKLRTHNYKTPTLKSVDDVIERKKLDVKNPATIANKLGTDSVLVIEITDWESDMLLTYAYLKLKARFTLYSKEGEKLWSAEHSTAESDIRLDKKSMELAIIKVYEPRVQRFINDLFSTMPVCNALAKRKEYFDWLP